MIFIVGLFLVCFGSFADMRLADKWPALLFIPAVSSFSRGRRAK